MKTPITIEAIVNAPIEKIWKYWNEPEHITQWCFASDDWHAPHASNDLVIGGQLNVRMESKDGTEGFDMIGTYTAVEEYKNIEYVMDDGRTVKTEFIQQEGGYKIIETFDPEDENPLEMQQAGWQAILNNFKQYVDLSESK